MKKWLLIFIMALITLQSCSLSVIDVQRGEKKKVYAKWDGIPLRKIKEDSTMDWSADKKARMFDEFICIGKANTRTGDHTMKFNMYLMQFEGVEYLVNANDVLNECEYVALNNYSNSIVLPKIKSDLYWSRAANYVYKHSEMKVQTQNEFLIDTYNPMIGNRAFKVTKEILEDDKIRITITCINDYNSFLYERKGILYVEKGDTCEDPSTEATQESNRKIKKNQDNEIMVEPK